MRAGRPCYSNCGPQSRNTSVTWDFLEMQNLVPALGLLNLNKSAFKQDAGDSCALKL